MDALTYSPTIYKLNQIDTMIQDINSREQYLTSFFNMWEQRVKLQYDYAEKIRSIYVNNPLVNTTLNDSNKPSQILFNTFVNILSKQSSNHQKLAEQLNDQVYKKLKQQIGTFQTENRKNLTLTKSLKKQLQSEQDHLQKCKNKLYKKSTEMQKLKIDYINATLLQDRDFEKKNKLFLKIKEVQTEILPIKKNYQTSVSKYNDTLSTTLTKFNQICKRIEQKQIEITNYIKRCLIDSQLFFSAFGAILVHQTQTILTYLDSIQIGQNKEIKSRSIKQIQEQRSHYQNSFLIPSEYLDETFKKVQNNSIQEIILYGKNPEYKKQLSHYFQNSDTFEEFKNLKVINCYTVRIVEIFKSVFEGTQFSASSLIEFRELIRGKPTLRKDFIFCLQKYRLDGKFKIINQNLPNIIELLNIFLDICQIEHDTYNSKQFMVLSFTYYFINEEGQKIDLQFCVKSHKIWQNIKWWQCSLIQSIYEEHKVKKRKSDVSNSPIFSLWDIKSSSLKKIDSNSQQASNVQNICFNQLAYYLHNMQLFGISWNQVNGLAQKYIKVFGLSSKMATDLQNMCLGLKKQSQSPQRLQKS